MRIATVFHSQSGNSLQIAWYLPYPPPVNHIPAKAEEPLLPALLGLTVCKKSLAICGGHHPGFAVLWSLTAPRSAPGRLGQLHPQICTNPDGCGPEQPTGGDLS